MISTPNRLVWTAFLRAKDEGSANKLLFRLQEALACPLEVSDLGRYSKDEALYRCTFSTALPRSEEGAGLRESVLALAGRVASIWQVGGLDPDGDFWGSTHEHIVVSGVESLNFGLGYPEARGS